MSKETCCDHCTRPIEVKQWYYTVSCYFEGTMEIEDLECKPFHDDLDFCSRGCMITYFDDKQRR